MATEQATFGAGCFWGVELKFRQLDGVTDAAVGYMGGTTEAPSYEDVCTGATGHAEVVHLTFDPEVISYETLVREFFELHDPTTLNRQGPDRGTQYRSVVFTYGEDQQATVERVISELTERGAYNKPIVTQVEDAEPFTFNRAEEYHQQYLAKRGMATCHI